MSLEIRTQGLMTGRSQFAIPLWTSRSLRPEIRPVSPPRTVPNVLNAGDCCLRMTPAAPARRILLPILGSCDSAGAGFHR